jgi:DNA-binding NarL/FixJ family response regulator
MRPSALETDAPGYLLKDSAPGYLLEAFETVRRHMPYLRHELAVKVALLGMRGHGNIFVGPGSR